MLKKLLLYIGITLNIIAFVSIPVATINRYGDAIHREPVLVIMFTFINFGIYWLFIIAEFAVCKIAEKAIRIIK